MSSKIEEMGATIEDHVNCDCPHEEKEKFMIFFVTVPDKGNAELIDDLTNQLADSKKAVDRAIKSIIEKANIIKDLEERLSKANVKISNYEFEKRSQNRFSSPELEKLKQENLKKEIEIIELKKEINVLEENETNNANRIHQLHKQSKVKNEEIMYLQDLNKSLKEQNEELQKSVKDCNNEKCSMEGHVEEILQKFEKAEEEFLAMNSEMDKLEIEKEDFKTQVQELLQENKQISQSSKSLKFANYSLKKKLTKHKDEFIKREQTLKASLKLVKNEKDEKIQTIDKLEKELLNQKKVNTKITMENKSLVEIVEEKEANVQSLQKLLESNELGRKNSQGELEVHIQEISDEKEKKSRVIDSLMQELSDQKQALYQVQGQVKDLKFFMNQKIELEAVLQSGLHDLREMFARKKRKSFTCFSKKNPKRESVLRMVKDLIGSIEGHHQPII